MRPSTDAMSATGSDAGHTDIVRCSTGTAVASEVRWFLEGEQQLQSSLWCQWTLQGQLEVETLKQQ